MKGMNRFNRWLCALLAALMAFGGCGALAEAVGEIAAPAARLTLADLEALGATAYIHDGRVTFVDGACTEAPVESAEDAAQVVDAMLTLLGGDERTRFEPWRTVADAAGNRYYVFQQMYAGTTVSGGAVKVVTDESGAMLGLVASVASELPDAEAAEGITARRAEALALEHMRAANQPQAELLEGRTEMIVLPVNLEIDLEAEVEESRFVWAVYTTNPSMNMERSSDLPFLAHYVTLDGAYLYSLPTILPGDEAGVSGYSAAYVFEFMEPVDYTGTVTLSDGSQREITVSLMRDSRTGMYYMANLQRRIAVADCYEFLYNDGHVVLEASRDNAGWDENSLLALYNYCRAWDYYREIGWIGGDGQGTPILILKDFCNGDRAPMDNAAYAGRYYGWQTFLSSSVNDYSQCLDVLAHEFTHCVTGSVMTYNAYMNDYGAINEAMSDIQGNICEMMLGATEDTTWLIGENSRNSAIRSMSDPYAFQQPAYAWDIYYVPTVKSPTTLNDRGGVHTNSSLLNNVAYRLCADGGMSLADARAFWFAVDCAMVPGTDYAQQSELMPWVLKHQDMGQYVTALEAALDATRLRTAAAPDTFDDDRALVTLTLPDEESFGDGNWMLLIVSVNFKAIRQRVDDILARRGEYAGVLDELAAAVGLDPALLPTEAELAADPDHAWDRLAEEITGMFGADLDAMKDGEFPQLPDIDSSDVPAKLSELFKKYFGDAIYMGSGAAGQDGRSVRMVCRPGTTLPLLYRLEIDEELHVHSVGLAAYTLGTWTDVAALIAPILQEMEAAEAEPSEAEDEALSEEELSELLDLLNLGDGSDLEPELPAWMGNPLELLDNTGWLWKMIFFEVKPGQTNVIPAAGLEDVAVMDIGAYPFLEEMFDLAALAQGEAPEDAETGGAAQ